MASLCRVFGGYTLDILRDTSLRDIDLLTREAQKGGE